MVGLDISGYQINVGTNYSINVAGLIWEDASNYELATDVDLSKTYSIVRRNISIEFNEANIHIMV